MWGDQDAITQVCYNLLDNAIKFAREGGSSLEIKSKGQKAYITIGDGRDHPAGGDPADL